ncbi:MAG: hypothetical protein COA78_32765 [Blastopirellula sp.]|nr:MAG: hypothetical protein COA78_32765 [Blastopirellula sp.]
MTEIKTESSSTPRHEKSGYEEPTQFKIVHLMYISAMLASALGTFGSLGLMPGLLICIFWTPVFLSQNRPKAFLYACLASFLFCCLIFCSLPMVSQAREAARRMQCTNHLKQLGLALHNYHDTYGTLPPAYIADANGKPMHSWRVLILPFIEEQTLYNQYDFDEPWDGPNNSKLATRLPYAYVCPSYIHEHGGHRNCTSYVAITGPNSIWNGETTTKFADITDGMRNTLLLTECDEQQIPWLKPDDVEYDVAINVFTSSDIDTFEGHQSETFFYEYLRGRNLLLADGSVRFCDFGTTQNTWAALIGMNDQTPWTDDDLEAKPGMKKRLRIGNCIRLGFFLFLMAFPLPWVWINPTPRRKTKSPLA